MEVSQLLQIIQNELDEVSFHHDKDWEYTTASGNGVNAHEAYTMLSSLARQINSAAGKELISFTYDLEELKTKYASLGYGEDEDEEE